MSQWCKVACGLCKPNYAMTECNDRHTKCGAWARSGECTRNPDWMAENCRSSCYKCGVTRAAKCGDIGGRNPTPIARRRPAAQPALVQCNPVGCFNENICCPFWGQQGQCAANAAWMSCNCRVTCGICRPQYAYGTCADYHLSCRQWAVIGECQKNPWMLENCRTSCRTCLNANQLRQRCQGGGRGRRRGRSADARSAFDINFNDIEISQGMPSINFTERNFRL
uniref:ShKT domain-containing protein n=1 Tax=Acrobeloides nanus TaxID=290746 RepID=A0A914C9X5_9BILA